MMHFLAYIVPLLACSLALSTELSADRESCPVNEFSINLLKHQIRINKDNTTLSSLSAANTLAALHALSGNSTRKQIEKVLKSPGRVLSIIPNIKGRQPSGRAFFKQPEYAWAFRAAEGMFSTKYDKLEDGTKAFQNSINLVKIDFSSIPKARKTINKWVNGQTEFQINDFLQDSIINPETNLLIINAVSLKGSWKYPFNPKETHLDPFYSKSKTASVPMMSRKRVKIACHSDNSGLVSIGLPYDSPESDPDAAAELALIIVMPGKETELADFIENSSIESLQAVMPRTPQEVELEFPRFKSFGKTISLQPVFRSMGLTRIFAERREENDISCSKKTGKATKVDDIFHQCFLAISETGTEPLPTNDKSVLPHEELSIQSELPHICINRPFMWFIYDMNNRCIIFIGALFSPSPD